MNEIIVSRRSASGIAKRSLLPAFLCLVFSVCPAKGYDDLRSLELFNGTETEIVSGNRSPRPASQTAENITVVTSDDIEALNAHTLSDILNTVTGVQLEMIRTPGTVTNLEVQGSNFNHLLVLIDNVPINNLADNVTDVSSVPVQMIERIEIVKGAASSSWGSALGGVINIITKSPESERPFGGMVSASLGKRETADGRVEVTGTSDRFGYYLTGGKLRSDGLLPSNHSDLTSFYGKLQYDLPASGSLTFSNAIADSSSGQLVFQEPALDLNNNLLITNVDVDQKYKQLISTLALQLPLSHRFALDASLRTRHSTSEILLFDTTQGFAKRKYNSDDSSYGATVKLSWLGERQRVVAGADYDHVETTLGAYAKPLLAVPPMQAEELKRADRVGVYLIDTVTVGAFAITPSARFDRTGSGGDHFSPSFGITYALSENTILRGYTARGYSLTSLNRTQPVEKVWTSQLGFESGELPSLWLKGTLFRNDTWDVIAGPPGAMAEQRQVKQGVEIEARTLPVFYTSLSTGYTFIDGKIGGSGSRQEGVPRHTVKIGIRYQDPSSLSADLTGNYINWNQPTGRYGAIIWDLHLRKEIGYSEYGSGELFLSVRNLLNDYQYVSPYYQNAGRWAEAGVRCNF